MKRIKAVFRHWLKVDVAFLSAAVTFYAALALFPVLLLLLSLFGWFLSSSESVQDWSEQVLGMISDRTSKEFADVVETQLENIEKNTSLTGSLGVLSLFAFSMAFFSNLERSFGKIWELPRETFGIVSRIRRILFNRIKAYLMILLLVVVVVANFFGNVYLEKLGDFVPYLHKNESIWRFIQTSVEILLNALLFAGIYQIMTREKVKWSHAILGGLLGALLWQPGRYLIATYLISDRYTAFGIVGAFWAVLLWIYYGINTILFGATVVHVAGKSADQL